MNFSNSAYENELENELQTLLEALILKLDESVQNVSINSLANLQFTMHYETLDNKILNKNLFKNVIEINLFGVISSIEIGLFKDFPKLKSLDINVNNLKVIMHQDLAWLTYLNEKIKQPFKC